MPFHPQVDQELTIDGTIYRVAEHPAAPGMPYGQEGRAAVVYQLVVGSDRRALKVFKPRYRAPGLVSLAERIEPYADLPGLSVCRRTVLNARRHKTLLSQYPDLAYAVLMPWVAGPTWMEVMLDKRPFTPEESLNVARGLVEVLVVMEEQELAHCDLSAPNVMLPALAGGKGVELVDVEGMYGADLKHPREILSNSPGYGHKMADEGIWGPEADRFAGAVLLAEMLGWCDERVREAAIGDPGYFAQEEVQQEGERYRVLMTALEEWWGDQVATLFERAWRSEKLWDCPTFGEWLVALPEKLLAIKEEEQVRQAKPGQLVEATESNEVQSLLGTAHRFQGKGRFDAALEVYRRVREMAPAGSGLKDELAIIVRDLEGQQQGKEGLSSGSTEENRLAALFDDGLAAYRKGEWTKAKELWMEVVRREPGYIRDGKLVTAFLAKTQKREKNRQYSIVRWGWLLVLGAVLVCAILASLLVSWWERRDMAKPLFPTETIAATVTRTPTPESTIALTRTPLPILASRLPILTTNPTFASPQVVQATSISASIPTPIPAAKHSPSSGDYKGEWYVAGTMPQSMDNHGAISLTSIVCAFGGWETTTSFCGMVDDSGYIEQWKWGGRFEQFCGNFAWTQVDETAFVLGGLRADSVTPQVLRADLGQARVLDDWQSLEPLPIALEYPSAASVGQHIYFIGGRVDRRPVQDVFQSDYKNEVNTPWERVAPLPVGLSGHTAVTLQGRIYVLGGRSSAGEGPLSDKVYVTQVEGDGSLTGWSEISSLPVPMGWHMAVVFEDAIFVMGGIRDDSEYSPEVYYALVDPTTGDLGEWVPYTSLPTPVANSAAIVAQGRIIMMGGWSGNGKLMEVYATQPVWLGTP